METKNERGSDVHFTTGNAAFDALRSSLLGTVSFPGEDSFERNRRVWNGMIDRHPALIVQCQGVADVVKAIEYARQQNLQVSVRGGGHNVAGAAISEGGLVIDLSRMRGVRVDPQKGTVRAEGGARLGDIDRHTQLFGMATPMGVVSATGIAGLSLNGGMGLMTRKHGLTSDNLVSADVVTADGSILQVDAQNHPEVYWALRGGGCGFGVVTSFEFKLHPVGPDVYLGMVMYPAAEAQRILTFFREYMSTAPDELSAIAIYWSAPHEEPIPEEHRGAPVLVIAACYIGPPGEGERVVRPLQGISTPIADLSGVLPFLNAQQLFDPEYPNGRRYYWKSIYLNALNDDVIRVIMDYSIKRPSPITSVDMWALGGQFARVAPEATAFFRRDAPYLLGIEANWDDPNADEENITWVREFYSDMTRHSPGGVYLNFPGFLEEGDDLLLKTFGTNYSRLEEIKARYDPTNLFDSNITRSTPPV